MSYDAKEGYSGLYVAPRGNSAARTWIGKDMTTIELIEAAAAESFEDGAAYQDADGCVFLRRYAEDINSDGSNAWIDADGDSWFEGYPERPLAKLTAPVD